MEQHERELLIYTIRSGTIIKNGLKIIAPTIEQCLEAAAVFKESFDELKSVEGIEDNIARKIYDYFHE